MIMRLNWAQVCDGGHRSDLSSNPLRSWVERGSERNHFVGTHARNLLIDRDKALSCDRRHRPIESGTGLIKTNKASGVSYRRLTPS